MPFIMNATFPLVVEISSELMYKMIPIGEHAMSSAGKRFFCTIPSFERWAVQLGLA
jgi:hypothetical protein